MAIKASRDNLNAEWIVDENTYGVESIPGYYVFNFGILSAVTDGERYFSETRGNIYAYGDELSAGVISSIDRYSWFNLNTGDFQLYNKVSGDGLSFKNGKLTLGGDFNPETGEFGSTIQGIENLISKQGENVDKINKDFADYKETINQNLETLHTVTDDLQSQVDGNIMAWDGDYIPTLSNYPANEWNTNEEKSRHKGDYFDRTFMQDGKKVTKRYKFIQDNGIYQWLPIADSSSALALQEAREALGVAGSKAKLFYGDSIPSAPYDINDVWVKINGTILLSNSKRNEGYGQNQADWQVVNDTQVRLAQMSSDGVISREEKATIRNEKSQIDKEYQKYTQDATSYGVAITELKNAYDSLVNILVNIIKINEDTDFTFTGMEQQNQYNQTFADYYAARTSFANTIASKITEIGISNVQIGGVNLAKLTAGKVLFDQSTYFVRMFDLDEQIIAGQEYTVSWENLEIPDNADGYGVNVYLWSGLWEYGKIEIFINNFQGGKASFTIKTLSNLDTTRTYKLAFYRANKQLGNVVNCKLEKGNKATAWTPSMSDQQLQSEKIAQAKAELERKKAESYADGIVTEAEQNAIDEAQRRLDALQIGIRNLILRSKEVRVNINLYNNGFVESWNYVPKTLKAGKTYVANGKPREGVTKSLFLLPSEQYVNYEQPFTPKSDVEQLYIRGEAGTIGIVDEFIITEGNKAPSNWVPAIEDTQEEINHGKLFLRGTGFNRVAGNQFILNNNGDISKRARGLNLITINRNNLSIIDNLTYDVLSSNELINELTNKLNSLDESVIVTLTSYDSAASNNDMRMAIERCGGSGERSAFDLRVPYAFVGIPGIGKGNGIEVFTSSAPDAPYAEISTQIVNGIPIGVTIGKSFLVLEAQAKADAAKGKAENADINSAQAILDAATAQSEANKAIKDAQTAANAAAAAEREAAEAKDQSLKAFNDAKDALTKAENFDYLKAAFGDISTELSKGVVLSGALAVKDRSNNIVAGIAGTIPQGQTKYPMIFAGATSAVNANNAKVAIYADGSGWLAGKSISWDAAGNSTFMGKITSNSNGDRIIIDPNSRSLSMITSANKETLRLFFYDTSAQISLTSADDVYETVINPSGINIATNGNQHYSWIRATYATFKVSQMVINLTAAVNTGKEMYILGLDYFRNVGEATDRWATLMVHRKTGRIAMSETPD